MKRSILTLLWALILSGTNAFAASKENYFLIQVMKSQYPLVLSAKKEEETIKTQSYQLPDGQRVVRSNRLFYDSVIKKLKELHSAKDATIQSCVAARIYVEYAESSKKYTFETCNDPVTERSQGVRDLLNTLLSL